jgi:hypothetical protein
VLTCSSGAAGSAAGVTSIVCAYTLFAKRSYSAQLGVVQLAQVSPDLPVFVTGFSGRILVGIRLKPEQQFVDFPCVEASMRS